MALEYIRAGVTLVLLKLDRLARSLKQLIETAEMLDGRGIGIKSLTESIISSTSGGNLVFHIFSALAEFERSIIREHIRVGPDAARSRGKKRGGRPECC